MKDRSRNDAIEPRRDTNAESSDVAAGLRACRIGPSRNEPSPLPLKWHVDEPPLF